MEPDFWQRRWQTNEIAFHEPAPHRLLVAHWPLPPGPATVLVPLCGKSNDLAWLCGRGHRVVGVELSEIAVRDFFAERKIEPAVERRAGLGCWRAGDYELWCGDFFATTPDLLGDFAAVYDRAALIALPPGMRARYVDHLRGLCSGGERGLLIGLEYASGVLTPPPHSVGPSEVTRLYAPWCTALSRVGGGPTVVKGADGLETAYGFTVARPALQASISRSL